MATHSSISPRRELGSFGSSLAEQAASCRRQSRKLVRFVMLINWLTFPSYYGHDELTACARERGRKQREKPPPLDRSERESVNCPDANGLYRIDLACCCCCCCCCCWWLCLVLFPFPSRLLFFIAPRRRCDRRYQCGFWWHWVTRRKFMCCPCLCIGTRNGFGNISGG